MEQFDVQRVESLMRYAEFLLSMKASRTKIDRVIELIHEEIGGYVDPLSITKMYGDGLVVDAVCSLHPDVEKFIHQEVTKQMCISIEAKHNIEQFLMTLAEKDNACN